MMWKSDPNNNLKNEDKFNEYVAIESAILRLISIRGQGYSGNSNFFITFKSGVDVEKITQDFIKNEEKSHTKKLMPFPTYYFDSLCREMEFNSNKIEDIGVILDFIHYIHPLDTHIRKEIIDLCTRSLLRKSDNGDAKKEKAGTSSGGVFGASHEQKKHKKELPHQELTFKG